MHQSDRSPSILLTAVRTRQSASGTLPHPRKALAGTTRPRIVRWVARREPWVCDFETPLVASRGMTSHHAGLPRRAGLLLQRRDVVGARWTCYRLDPGVLGRPKEQFIGLLDLYRFDTAAAHRE